ncbi:MAG: hypothetical protein WBC33_12410 [Conexibacter sp.]
MAELIELGRHRSSRTASASPEVARTTLYFDLASPETYFVAERVERRFGDAVWCPAVLWHGTQDGTIDPAHTMAAAERRARELRMPLVWPERFPVPVPAAMRVATYAAERGCGSAFAIAAGRLAFCGGFDIGELDMVAEAAAAAGLEVSEALIAARDLGRDEVIVAAGRALGDGGMVLPALSHDGRTYCGEPQITAALSGPATAHTHVS